MLVYKTYGSWSGLKLRNGEAEGAIRHQTTKTHPVLALTLNESLSSFSHVFDKMETKEANKSNYRKSVSALNDSVDGLGRLLNQKSIAIATSCGRVLNTNWLKHCLPGSSHHFSCLKQSPFFFKSPDQVMQLAHCLSSLGDQNGPMNGPKVDEVICKTLKGSFSAEMFHDVVIAGQDLYYTTNCGTNLSVTCRRSSTRNVDTVAIGGFSSTPESHYKPYWTEMCDAAGYSSLQVFMSSDTNYQFNISSKSEKKIEKESACSILPTFDIHEVQMLPNKNFNFALKEPLVFVADYLGVDSDQLSEAIHTYELEDDGGWMATVSEELMNGLLLKLPYVGICETMSRKRRPLFGIKHKSGSKWSYQNKYSAFASLLLHLLFNTQMSL